MPHGFVLGLIDAPCEVHASRLGWWRPFTIGRGGHEHRALV